MHKKKRRILLVFRILILIQANVPLLNAAENLKKQKKDDENIFVFPSMQMEGIAAASRDSKHVPVVEVVYRGQPPSEKGKITSTTKSSSEVITSTRTTRGKFFYLLIF